MEMLHVYAAEYPHGDVYIAGTTEALKALRQAIDEAIEHNKSISEEFFTNDGEGFGVLVATVDEATVSSYVEPYAELQRNGPGPWLLFR